MAETNKSKGAEKVRSDNSVQILCTNQWGFRATCQTWSSRQEVTGHRIYTLPPDARYARVQSWVCIIKHLLTLTCSDNFQSYFIMLLVRPIIIIIITYIRMGKSSNSVWPLLIQCLEICQVDGVKCDYLGIKTIFLTVEINPSKTTHYLWGVDLLN